MAGAGKKGKKNKRRNRAGQPSPAAKAKAFIDEILEILTKPADEIETATIDLLNKRSADFEKALSANQRTILLCGAIRREHNKTVGRMLQLGANPLHHTSTTNLIGQAFSPESQNMTAFDAVFEARNVNALELLLSHIKKTKQELFDDFDGKPLIDFLLSDLEYLSNPKFMVSDASVGAVAASADASVGAAAAGADASAGAAAAGSDAVDVVTGATIDSNADIEEAMLHTLFNYFGATKQEFLFDRAVEYSRSVKYGTILFKMAIKGRFRALSFLIENECCYFLTDDCPKGSIGLILESFSYTLAKFGAARSEVKEVVRIVIKFAAENNLPEMTLNKIMYLWRGCIEFDNVDLMKVIAGYYPGTAINKQQDYELPPLSYAAQCGSLKALEFLCTPPYLEDINLLDCRTGSAALHYAVMSEKNTRAMIGSVAFFL